MFFSVRIVAVVQPNMCHDLQKNKKCLRYGYAKLFLITFLGGGGDNIEICFALFYLFSMCTDLRSREVVHNKKHVTVNDVLTRMLITVAGLMSLMVTHTAFSLAECERCISSAQVNQVYNQKQMFRFLITKRSDFILNENAFKLTCTKGDMRIVFDDVYLERGGWSKPPVEEGTLRGSLDIDGGGGILMSSTWPRGFR